MLGRQIYEFRFFTAFSKRISYMIRPFFPNSITSQYYIINFLSIEAKNVRVNYYYMLFRTIASFVCIVPKTSGDIQVSMNSTIQNDTSALFNPFFFRRILCAMIYRFQLYYILSNYDASRISCIGDVNFLFG